MIRPITCIGFILACASGFYLYQTKHRVTVVNRDIANVVHETSIARDQIRVLVAEYALLTTPDRIQQFADQHLGLKPTDPSQFTSLAELDCRLPPIPSPDGTPAACAPSSEPPPVASSEVVAQAEPALTANAQIPPATDGPAPSPPEASAVPPGSPAVMAETRPSHAEAARAAVDVAQVQRPQEVEAGKIPTPTGTSEPPLPEAVPVPASVSVGPDLSEPPAVVATAQPTSSVAVATPVSAEPAQPQRQLEAQATSYQAPPAKTVQVPPPASTLAPSRPVPASASATIALPTPAPAAVTVAAVPSSQDAEAARLAAELAQLRQQHEAEAARNRLLQEEVDRLAAQIAQRQKSLEALHAQAVAVRQPLPIPAAPPPAVAVAAQPAHQDAAAARFAAALVQLKQQHEAEVAINRRLQAEMDRLAGQMGQQAPHPKLASAKDLPTPSVAPPALSSFNTVESIVTRLRHEQTVPREAPPHEIQPSTPAPAPAAAAMTAQYRPPVRASSPWVELMNARAALSAGDPYSSRQRLEAAQAALLSQPSRRHYFAAEQISMAVALINAGANLPALHFLDLAIANAGGGVPYAAESMAPPQAYYPPPAFQP